MNLFNHKKLNNLVSKKFKTNKEFLICLQANGLEKGEDALKKWRQGNSTPKTNELPTIVECLECDILDLYENSEDTKISIVKKELQKNPKKYTNLLPSADDFISINIHHDINISAGFGGNGFIDIAPEQTFFEKNFLRKFYKVENLNNLEMVKVTGDSMEPLIKDGEYIFVEKNTRAKDGSIVIARINDELFVKKIYKDPFNKWVRLESLNEAYPAIELNEQEISTLEIIAIVRSRIKVF